MVLGRIYNSLLLTCFIHTLKYLLFFTVKSLAEVCDPTNNQRKNLFVGDPIYGVTIDARVLEKLTLTASTRKKLALTLLEKLFPGDVLAKSTVAGSKQSKTVAALDNNKLVALKSMFNLASVSPDSYIMLQNLDFSA